MAKKHFELVILQLLLAMIVMLYMATRLKGANVLFFWPIMWLLILVTFLITYKLPTNYKLISLAVLSISISLIRILALPEIYELGRDDVFEAQFASTIARNGIWDPVLGAGFAENYYGYYPALHFILSITSLTTGLTVYELTKYIFFIIFRLAIAMLVYAVIRLIVSRISNISYLSALLFIGSSGMSFIGITRRTMAAIFLLLAFFAILKERNSANKLLWNGLYILFSFMLVISDRSISIYFITFLIGAALFPKILKLARLAKEEVIFPNFAYKLLYFAVIFAAWRLFVTSVTNEQDLVYIKGIYEILSSSFGLRSLLDLQGSYKNIGIYHGYELAIIYISQFLFIVLGFIGLLFFVKDLSKQKALGKHADNELFLVYFSLYGFFLYAISFFFMKTEFDVAIIIFLWFFCIPISIFAAYFLEFIAKNAIPNKAYFALLVFIVLFLYTGSLMMGLYTPRITNRGLYQDIIVDVDDRAKTRELFYSAAWLGNNNEGKFNLIGGMDVYELYSGFFEFNVNLYPGRLRALYSGDANKIIGLINERNVEFGIYEHTFHFDELDYAIISKAFSKYRSMAFPARVPLRNIEQLNNISMLDKVYSNGEVDIYKIERSFSGSDKIA